MAKSLTIKNRNGDTLYPVTVSSLVYDRFTGNSVELDLNSLLSQVSELLGVEDAFFGGIVLTSSDIITDYSSNEYEGVYLYMVGTDMASLTAYLYSGSGSPTQLFSGATYDFTDYSEIKQEIGRIDNEIYDETSSTLSWTNNKQIYTSANVGSSPTLKVYSSDSWRYLSTSCTIMDKFFIDSASGGSSARLWCFLDSNNKVVAVSAASANADNLTLQTPEGAVRFIVNDSDKTGSCIKITKFSKIDSIEDKLDPIDVVPTENSANLVLSGGVYSSMEALKNIELLEPITWIVGKQIYTNASVGAAPSLSVKSADGWAYFRINCAEGDMFIINGSGGSSPRLWCFLDSENKVVSVAAASTTASRLKLVAPENAVKLVVNNSDEVSVCYKLTTSELLTRYTSDVYAAIRLTLEWTAHKLIYTAAAIGAKPSLTVYEGNSYSTKCIDIPCYNFKSVIINGSGGSSPRLWCMLDAYSKVVAISEAEAEGNNTLVTVPSNAVRLIINDLAAYSREIPVYCYANIKTVASEAIEELDTIVKNNITSNVTNSISYRRFSPCKFFGNLPAANGSEGSFMNVSLGYNHLISLYDQLVTSHPNEITKVSIGYDASGEIETFAYEFSPKYYKLIVLLIAGTHADEVNGVASLLRIMQLIYSDTQDEDLLFLRQSCKFVIIPCLNPWGYPTDYVNADGQSTQSWDSDVCVETVNARTYLANFAPTASFLMDMHTTGGGTMYLDFYGNMLKSGKNLHAIFRAVEWLCDNYALEGRTVADQKLGYLDHMHLCRYYMYRTYGVQTSTMEYSDGNWSFNKLSAQGITLAVTMWLNYIVQQANEFYRVIEQDVSADLKVGLG